MNSERKLTELKAGEKAVFRYTAGDLLRLTTEFIFDGDEARSVVIKQETVQGGERSTRVDLTDSQLRNVDEYLSYLRAAPADRGATTAAPVAELEWLDRPTPVVEHFTNAEPNAAGVRILAQLLTLASGAEYA